MISEETINEIRKSSDIVDIVSEYIPLTKKGKNFFGLCPFHDDHSPSMSVSKEKQIYTCFSCVVTSNVFNLLMDYENISFVDTIKKLADKTGISINLKNYKQPQSNEKYLEIYDITQKLYQNNINTKTGLIAKEYLNKRGINEELIHEFEIGYASNKNEVNSLLRKKSYSNKEIEETGLIREDHDFLYNRITIPISNEKGAKIA